MGLLVHVNCQGKRRHAAGKYRDDLSDPYNRETRHPAQVTFCLGLHYHLIDNITTEWQFYNKKPLFFN
jgi:hypothetical protein